MTVSSFETGSGGVKAYPAPANWVRVEDLSQGSQSPILAFSPDQWDAFVAGVKAGEFDRANLAP